jgi:hypothetical protein
VNDGSKNWTIQFSESNGSWGSIPEWANFLVMFGYTWYREDLSNRRIALISMPCDSAGAGLVALGTIRKFLEFPRTDDISLHLKRIRKDQGKILLSRNYPGSRFHYYGYSNIDMIEKVKKTQKYDSPSPERVSFKPEDICFQGEPFPQVIEGHELPYGIIYKRLISGDGNILTENLRKTYSGSCLAGRNLGEKATRDIMACIQFRLDNLTASLDQLLTVHSWTSGGSVSRLSLYNSRTDKIDRQVALPQIVIADGDGALFSVLNNSLFENSDVIATIDRTLERERLEKINEVMASKSQWYIRDESVPLYIPSIPPGITIAIWNKR